jgi:post-segregation antitoxin (ccd killing protein)
MKRRQISNTPKRRTTLTLPADSLIQASRIARARKVNLSTVISEALSNGLRMQAATERGEEVLKAYKKAFSGFSEEDMLLLDGIVMDPATKHR